MAGLSGFSGSVSGYVPGILDTWSVTITRAVSDITGFSNVGHNRVLGLWDITGSAGGKLDATTATSGTAAISPMTGVFTSGGTVTMVLEANGATEKITFPAVIDQVSMGVSKAGDATVSFSFGLATPYTATGTAAPYTLTWV